MIYQSIEELIGNTPMLLIPPHIHGVPNADIYAKLEYYNPFGSVKDRIGKGMLDPILDNVKKNKKTILEASSGNTAKALAILAAMHGLEFKTITNRIKIPEVRMMLQTLGAQIDELPGLSDCPDPMDPNDFTTVAANLAKQHPDLYHYTDQYFNERNRDTHYETLGKEIIRDCGTVDFFIGFLGTCGSSVGAGSALKEHCETKVIGVVADAGHHVPGGRNENELWEVGFFSRDFYHAIVSGTTQKAIEGMLELNRKVGMLCGPTTGLTYATAREYLIAYQKNNSSTERIKAVFIACDRLEPYMSYAKKYKPELYAFAQTTRQTVYSIPDERVAASPTLMVVELNKKMNDYFVIDIRARFAYSIGHIPGSMNIMDEMLSYMIEEGPAFPFDKPIVIVCRIGTISKQFAAFLGMQGYTAFSLEGGIMEWKQAGHELIQSPYQPHG